MTDDELLASAEEALTEIKIADGLSERHAAVLAALRIRLTGTQGKSLEEMLEAADDSPTNALDAKVADADADAAKKPSLDDLFGQEKPKPDWPT